MQLQWYRSPSPLCPVSPNGNILQNYSIKGTDMDTTTQSYSDFPSFTCAHLSACVSTLVSSIQFCHWCRFTHVLQSRHWTVPTPKGPPPLSFCDYPPPQTLVATTLSSIPTNLSFRKCDVSGIILSITLRDWIFSLSITAWGVIQVVMRCNGSFPCTAESKVGVHHSLLPPSFLKAVCFSAS